MNILEQLRCDYYKIRKNDFKNGQALVLRYICYQETDIYILSDINSQENRFPDHIDECFIKQPYCIVRQEGRL